MAYIDLNGIALENSDGEINLDLLQHICNTINKPIRYIGWPEVNTVSNDKKYRFNNLIYASAIISANICEEYPELISADHVVYKTTYYDRLDICNIEKVNTFFLRRHLFESEDVAKDIIRNHINIIDESTLIINGKKLIVEEYWNLLGIVDSVTIDHYEKIVN